MSAHSQQPIFDHDLIDQLMDYQLSKRHQHWKHIKERENMNYITRLQKAFNRTKQLGLITECSPFPLQPRLPTDLLQAIFQQSGDALYENGYEKSSDLASKCAQVHLMLQHILRHTLQVESFITIGDRFWHDYIYCEMSDEGIINELRNPKINEPSKAHIWLTLVDGTILDCTAEAHADILFDRGEHPAHQCMMVVPPDQQEDDKRGYHRPFLLGTDFLLRTGTIHRI